MRHILWLMTSLGNLTRGCTVVKSEDSFWHRGPNQSQSVSINLICFHSLQAKRGVRGQGG